MSNLESLGMDANHWRFLNFPEKYVDASASRPLVPTSTERQFRTARDILKRLSSSYGRTAQRGVLLADDVGLGKTTVAALVAWVVATNGGGRTVRILAPNDVMMRRWEEELLSHVEPLAKCAWRMKAQARQVKARRVERLSPGSIQVVKHSYASSENRLACDLLIVDEAHRAKGDKTAFSEALKKQKRYAHRVLILTATPFSIRLEEMLRMLKLIDGEAASAAVRGFSRALDELYMGNSTGNHEIVAEKLCKKALAAVKALAPFVIRHGIDDLPEEQPAFGTRTDWNIVVPPANESELELMLRMDRALHLAQGEESETSMARVDPRFHVGWRHFDRRRQTLKAEVPKSPDSSKAVLANHVKRMHDLRDVVGHVHSKMDAVAASVKEQIELGEKVVLFCHHHATAQELTVHLDSVLPERTMKGAPSPASWAAAWNRLIDPPDTELNSEQVRNTFLKWLCSDPIRSQTWTWICVGKEKGASLVDSLRQMKSREIPNAETISEAANRLYRGFLQSKSSRAVLKTAGSEDSLELIPGACGKARVLGVCEPSDHQTEQRHFIHNQQPDTIISIFNSPFGPDVLVVTDKLAEGIDLHRYCRHLVHYELDPSPIRTVQRNGRLRRVNSWAAISGQPIRYAYPAFYGTRDHRLVQIMRKRINSFSLLMGGVQDIDVDEVADAAEKWRNDVIIAAKAQLAKLTSSLRANQ
jgi:ERCC4-related helicase